MRDLEIQGRATCWATSRAAVAAVEFELYLEMLNDAVLEGRGGTRRARGPRGGPGLGHYIPGDYVALEAAKIDLHRRIGLAEDLDRVAALRAKLEDRFGPVPPPVDALLAVFQRLRIKLRDAGASSQLALRGGRVTIAPVSLTARACARSGRP